MSIESSWKSAHTILLVIGFVVAGTVSALTFFAWASDLKDFKNDTKVYQLESQAAKVQDRIIELEKEGGKKSVTPMEKVNNKAEKRKWEMQLDYINKKIEFYQKGGK
jgi:hypothetical protein